MCILVMGANTVYMHISDFWMVFLPNIVMQYRTICIKIRTWSICTHMFKHVCLSAAVIKAKSTIFTSSLRLLEPNVWVCVHVHSHSSWPHLADDVCPVCPGWIIVSVFRVLRCGVLSQLLYAIQVSGGMKPQTCSNTEWTHVCQALWFLA